MEAFEKNEKDRGWNLKRKRQRGKRERMGREMKNCDTFESARKKVQSCPDSE